MPIVHELASQVDAIFKQVLELGSDNENMEIYYFAEVSRQAEAVLKTLVEAQKSANLQSVIGVVEFFYAAYLSRSSLEAIAKLLKQHASGTDSN